MNLYNVSQKNGEWQLLDPDGNSLFSLGVDCVTRPNASNSDFDIVEKYGGDGQWFQRFADKKLTQLKEYEFNTLGSWHEKYYWGNDFPKTVEIRCSSNAQKANTTWGTGFPDVFDESFPASVHRAMVDCFYGKGEKLIEDEDLIGYYTDNELHWWGSSGYWGQNNPGASGLEATGLVDDYISLGPDTAGKKAWVNFLQEKYNSIENLNQAWESEYLNFDDILHLQHYRAKPEVFQEDKRGFLKIIAEKYFQTTSSILKQYDSEHMNLGCRVVGVSTPDIVFEVMKKYVDIISINFYSLDLPENYLDQVYNITEKPMIVTEFSFCAGQQAGFVYSTNGARNVLVKNQQRRGECYESFIKQINNIPYMLGAHWFALYDYGSKDGLIGNYGLLDLEDKPYQEFTAKVTEVNKQYN